MPFISIPNFMVSTLATTMTVSPVAIPVAQAQLGATVQTASMGGGAVAHRARGGQVTWQEATDAHGIVVREYVDSSGSVYAVSWRGPAMPNVEALLGDHFARFRDGAKSSVGEAGLHAASVSDGDLVVENRVRLREFSGRAWLASALPAGVSASDIE